MYIANDFFIISPIRTLGFLSTIFIVDYNPGDLRSHYEYVK